MIPDLDRIMAGAGDDIGFPEEPSVRYLIVQPMSRVVAHMISYRDAPEDVTRVIAPRSDVRELACPQEHVGLRVAVR